MKHDSTNNRSLKEDEIEGLRMAIKNEMRDVMHEHRLLQKHLEVASGYNQSTVQRYLDPFEVMMPKLDFVILLAQDERTKPVAVELIRMMAQSAKLDVVPEVDRTRLNGTLEDEERDLFVTCSQFISEAAENPDNKHKLLARLRAMEEVVQKAKAEIESMKSEEMPQFLGRAIGR